MIAAILGITVRDKLGKYLGITLDEGKKNYAVYKNLEEKKSEIN